MKCESETGKNELINAKTKCKKLFKTKSNGKEAVYLTLFNDFCSNDLYLDITKVKCYSYLII